MLGDGEPRDGATEQGQHARPVGRAHALRLVDQGGVRIDGAVVSDRGLKVGAGIVVVQVGKRKFARVTIQ